MEALVHVLRRLSNDNPFGNVEWSNPPSWPIEMPASLTSSLTRNLYLKEHFRETIRQDESLESHYWAVREWGSIGSFRKNDNNDNRIRSLILELEKGSLSKRSFSCISSLSKIASFLAPDKYAIYDSRAVYSLNWLLFNYSDETTLFPHPPGRNSKLAKFDMQTIFRLSGRPLNYKPSNVAYHEYCKLLGELARSLFKDENKPYLVEMLLFVIAPDVIVQQIEKSVSLRIDLKAICH